MKSINRLLKLVAKQEYLFCSRHYAGLCELVTHMHLMGYFSRNKYSLLLKYIKEHKPKPGERHYQTGFRLDTNFYWPMFEWEPRYAWLQDQIKNNFWQKLKIWYRAEFDDWPYYRVIYKDNTRTRPLHWKEAKGLKDVFDGKIKIDYTIKL